MKTPWVLTTAFSPEPIESGASKTRVRTADLFVAVRLVVLVRSIAWKL